MDILNMSRRIHISKELNTKLIKNPVHFRTCSKRSKLHGEQVLNIISTLVNSAALFQYQ